MRKPARKDDGGLARQRLDQPAGAFHPALEDPALGGGGPALRDGFSGQVDHGVGLGQALRSGLDIQCIPNRALHLRPKPDSGMADQRIPGVGIAGEQARHEPAPDETRPSGNRDVHCPRYCMRKRSCPVRSRPGS